jgi:glycosyltransferase involved in cell wall biosynthesis
MHPDGGGRLKRYLEEATFTYALDSTVFCRTPDIRGEIRSRSNRRVEIIYGILNEEVVRRAKTEWKSNSIASDVASTDMTSLTYVGRLSRIKNVPKAVDAIANLSEHFELLIVGDGPERSNIEAKVNELDVGDRVTLLGEMAHEDALTIIAASDGLVLPSLTEAFPTVVFEGLSLGCEVFATPVGILPEIDHPRLHLQPADQFANRIADTEFQATHKLDSETLEKYSLERYTDAVLEALESRGAEH